LAQEIPELKITGCGERFGNEHVFFPCAYPKTGYMYVWFELESLLAC